MTNSVACSGMSAVLPGGVDGPGAAWRMAAGGVDVISEEVQERGAHLIIAKTPRIPAASVDPAGRAFR